VDLRGVVTSSGISAKSVAKRFGFSYCCSSIAEVLSDPGTNLVFIATRHAQHAELACQALAAGKAVFVEKPLATSLEQLRLVHSQLASNNPGLIVGFNRRFASLAKELKAYITGHGPQMVQYRCNAGPLPPDHWMADTAEGGRIIGEACHFFDFFAYLTDARPQTIYALAPAAQANGDDAQITVEYTDGSVCQLLYTSLGSSTFSKERVEVFAGGRVGTIEDFRCLYLGGGAGRGKRHKLWRADKGHAAELHAALNAVRSGGTMPIAVESLLSSTLVSLAALLSMRRRQPIAMAEMEAALIESEG
jgi:predicted dehydrogenase